MTLILAYGFIAVVGAAIVILLTLAVGVYSGRTIPNEKNQEVLLMKSYVFGLGYNGDPLDYIQSVMRFVDVSVKLKSFCVIDLTGKDLPPENKKLLKDLFMDRLQATEYHYRGSVYQASGLNAIVITKDPEVLYRVRVETSKVNMSVSVH